MPVPLDFSKYKYEKTVNQDNVSLKRQRTDEELTKVKRLKGWPGPLPPILEPGLKIVFVGFNPGVESGKQGHYYAHSSNRFWKFLFWSKIAGSLHSPKQDQEMPQRYRIGFTDLVPRCTKGINQLSKDEMIDGVASLDQRISVYKPQIVCLVGKGIWQTIAKARNWDSKLFQYGEDTKHKFGNNESILYCVASTSGLNSIPAEKQLQDWHHLRVLSKKLTDSFTN